MKKDKVWMTAEGYQQFQAQLQELRDHKRATIVRDMQEVSTDADWRENSQLILLQNELAVIDAEIRRLEELLAHSTVVEPQNADAIVDIGETVVLQMDGEVETYTIVSPAESAPDLGRISYESPVGHSLLKHKVGDEVTVTVPAGALHYRIVAVG
ncbi:MAG: transcription elongation factor GreA [Caldilineaceae bacterium]